MTTKSHTLIPSSINVRRADRVFEVLWDGVHFVRFKLDDLRGICECALCRAEEEKKEKQKQEAKGSRLLPVLGSVARAEIVSVEHVGRYALGVGWKDGHQSIYTYEDLFDLCQCYDCTHRREAQNPAESEASR